MATQKQRTKEQRRARRKVREPAVSPDADATRGFYRKFSVKRLDGSSRPGRKHDGCDYIVLDLHHDRHAAAALDAYADSCAATYPDLAIDLRGRANAVRRRWVQRDAETPSGPVAPERDR